MRLSNLQKFILLECYNSKTGRINRSRLSRFYDTIKFADRPKKNLEIKIITKSIERLINKGLLVGFGERTKEKWFIKEIKITVLGKKFAKKSLGEQLKFKFKKNKK